MKINVGCVFPVVHLLVVGILVHKWINGTVQIEYFPAVSVHLLVVVRMCVCANVKIVLSQCTEGGELCIAEQSVGVLEVFARYTK